MKKSLLLLCPTLLMGLLHAPAFCADVVGAADAAFVNGQFATIDPNHPEAEAVAVKDGVFIAVGSDADIGKYVASTTKVYDLHGQRVIPGLIDAHDHPVETLWMKTDWVDARFPGTPSIAVALGKIAERARSAAPGEWIFVACVSASENKFAEKRLPTKAELDAVAPDNPVALANGVHMTVSNTRALDALGIRKGQTRLPKGGSVLLDSDGNPTGVITDGFADMPGAPKPEEVIQYYASGIPGLWNEYGFTSIMAITNHEFVPLLKQVSGTVKQPNLRYTVSVWTTPDGKGFPQDLSAFDMPADADPNYYKVLGIKAWADGENDARTGYMYEPYEGHFDIDPAGGRGSLVTPQADADAFVDLAHANNRLAMLHCSGDEAIDICLTAFEQSAKADPSAVTMKRIEHFGVFQMSDAQLQRARDLKKDDFFITIQPVWLTELVKADVENMGADRAKTGFKFQSMIKAGLEPAASTDMTGIYLGNINPFTAMEAVVTRVSDMGVFEPQEAVSVEDAVRMWTIWPAKAIGEADHRGTIEAGKLADMTVLTQDIFTVPPDRIGDVQADATILGGRVVYKRP